MDEDDPRATQVHTSQQQQIQEVLGQLQKNSHINAFFVLTNYLDCPEIKNQPDFFHMQVWVIQGSLFTRNLDVVVELVEWMLIPKQLIKKKKIKVNVDSYPYQCRQFLKDNWCFYEQLYISLRKKRLEFSLFLKFLHKEYYDKSTVYTALGYFADVMIPFAKYEFSCSFNLIKSLELEALVDKVETFGIMKIMGEGIVNQLVGYSYYEPIFQFLKNVILISLEDSTQVNFAKILLIKLLKSCIVVDIFSKFSQSSITHMDANEQLSKYLDLFQSLAAFLKEVVQNMQQTDKLPRMNFHLIQVIVQSRILEYFQKQILSSKLCGNIGGVANSKLYSSVNMKIKNGKVVEDDERELLAQSAQGVVKERRGTISVNIGAGFMDVEEHQIVEVMVKILTALVDIYDQIPKKFPVKIQPETPMSQSSQFNVSATIGSAEAQKKFLSGSSPQTTPKSPPLQSSQPLAQTPTPKPKSPKKLKKAHQQITLHQYTTVLLLYREQIQSLLDNLDKMIVLVVGGNGGGGEDERSLMTMGHGYNRVIPFSSGENVKCVTFMKYQFFKLLNSCLEVWQESEVQLENTKNSTKKKDNEAKSLKQIKQGSRQTEPSQYQSRSQKVTITPPKQKPSQQIMKTIVQTPTNSNKLAHTDSPIPEQYKDISLPPFKLCVQKLHIIEIIKKYLIENRWNNIALVVLSQLCHILIINCYDYIKKNVEQDKIKKFSDSFLAYLIENFTKRDFIFLNTVKFTTQGNLYALYTISRDLAYSLNSTNELVIFLNEFEPWKKFIMNDLKNYEEKLFPNAIKADFYEQTEDQSLKVKVDEADSIKKLVEDISTTKKWPVKTGKIMSKSMKVHRGSFDAAKNAQKTKDYSHRKSPMDPEQKFQKFLKQSNKIDKIDDFVLEHPPVLQREPSIEQKQAQKNKILKKMSDIHGTNRQIDHHQ